jgi:hypothetical protein
MKQFTQQVFCCLALPGLLSLLFPLLGAAQGTATLTGTVRDQATGEPLPGASVFIAVSMTGTAASADGEYVLKVPVGAHRLYVSMLGYEPQFRDIVLREGGTHTYSFELVQTSIPGQAVVVTGERDAHWQQRLRWFITLFIGVTPNAQETVIVNANVLNFEVREKRFIARAAEPLIFENRALGYRIQYFLKEFGYENGRTWWDGEPLYEEMEPDSPAQAAIWEANRRKAWYGSFRHFILAVLDGQTEEEGFMIYRLRVRNILQSLFGGQPRYEVGTGLPIEEDDIYSDGPSPMEKGLDFNGRVEIVYMNEPEDPSYQDWEAESADIAQRQTSWIELERGPTIVDYKGDLADPYGVTKFGYFAFERMGDELPKEYRPVE